jgi:large subunit ribosomal protein L20
MARVKRGVTKNKRRKNILAQTKGYRLNRSTKERTAKEAIQHAGVHAFRGRKEKKRAYRQLFTLRINARAREGGVSYSKLMGSLKKANITLNRKSLSALAKDHPEVFTRLLDQVKA